MKTKVEKSSRKDEIQRPRKLNYTSILSDPPSGFGGETSRCPPVMIDALIAKGLDSVPRLLLQGTTCRCRILGVELCCKPAQGAFWTDGLTHEGVEQGG